MSRLTELKQKIEAEQRIAAKLATGKFKDTGKLYSAEQAVSDHSNHSLRMSATIGNNGSLEWK